MSVTIKKIEEEIIYIKDNINGKNLNLKTIKDYIIWYTSTITIINQETNEKINIPSKIIKTLLTKEFEKYIEKIDRTFIVCDDSSKEFNFTKIVITLYINNFGYTVVKLLNLLN